MSRMAKEKERRFFRNEIVISKREITEKKVCATAINPSTETYE